MLTVPFLCTLAAFLLNYLSKMPVAIAMSREGKGYDNKTPRDQQAKLSGWGKRALAAHLNGFEVTPLFAACVFIGHLSQGNADVMSKLAILFVVSRVFYIGLYIADIDKIRSLVWATGILSSFAIALSSWF